MFCLNILQFFKTINPEINLMNLFIYLKYIVYISYTLYYKEILVHQLKYNNS